MMTITFSEIGPFLVSESGAITVGGHDTDCPALVIGMTEPLETALQCFDQFNCKKLSVSLAPQTSELDFSKIKGLARLESLSISAQGSTKLVLDPVQEKGVFAGVTELELLGSFPSGFPSLSGLPNLKKLTIDTQSAFESAAGNRSLLDLIFRNYSGKREEAFGRFTALKRLCLVDCALQSLSFIESLSALQTLRIVNPGGLNDFSGLNKSESLENFALEGRSKVIDWSFLAETRKWKNISLSHAKSITFINELPNLEFFFCKKVDEKDNSIQKKHANLVKHEQARSKAAEAGTPKNLPFYVHLI